MVDERTTDGVRIARLLASEVTGRESGPLGRLSVVEAVDADALEPTEFGEYAYAVAADGERIAEVYVHPDRAHLELRVGLEAARAAAAEAGLRVRPKAVEPPRLLVFVEDGAEVKRAIDVLAAARERR